MIRTTFRFSVPGKDFGPRADGLITGHTWENAADALTVADGLAALKWQNGGVAGSYNDVICVDGIISSVPPQNASGGINPGSSAWAPKPWLFDLMSPEMVRNPNYFTRNIVMLGRRGTHDRNGWPPQMIDNFVTVMLEEEARIGSRTILTQHLDFQSNRSDAGNIAHKLILKRYLERTTMDWHNDIKYLAPTQVTYRPGTSYRRVPDLSEAKPTVLDYVSTRRVIGTVKGFDFGKGGTWDVIVSSGSGLLAVHPQDRLSQVVLAVPGGGITEAQAKAREAAARAAGIKAAAANAAATK